jgi:hypothetical protein
MSSSVIAVLSANSRAGAWPHRRSTSATTAGAKPRSLPRSVGWIATTNSSAVATCTL